jgi:anthranilate synthase component I
MLDMQTAPPRRGEAAPARYRPSLDEVRDHATRGNLVPIYREILADLETPVSAYLKLASGADYAILLESIEGGERLARYSFLAVDPYLTLRLDRGVAHANQGGYKQTSTYTDPLVALQSYLTPYQAVEVPDLPRFVGGAVGFLGYETVRYFEELPTAPGPGLSDQLPEGLFMFVETMVVFDHLRRKIKVVSHVHADADADLEREYAAAVGRIEATIAKLQAPYRLQHPTVAADAPAGVPRPNMSRDYYGSMLDRAKEYIAAGDIFQVVLAQRFSCPFPLPPLALYRALRRVNPSPFLYFLDLPGFAVVGSSPEILVRVRADEAQRLMVTVRPIAGTRPRGATPEEDAARERELLADPKECAEHLMLLDLGRNDVGRVAASGSVRVTDSFTIERYSHVMHIVSQVEGELAPDRDAVDALFAGFPAGTVSGAPKVRACQIIAELEPEARGAYAGGVGYFAPDGSIDSCIVLRTAVVKDGVMHVQAGAGIVADSDPLSEQRECEAKAGALIAAAAEAFRIAGEPLYGQ